MFIYDPLTFFLTDIDLYVHCLTLSSGGRADRPAAGGPVALWEIPGCSGASAKLAERHGGAGGQSEASVCRVPRRQGADPRTKGRRRMEGQKIKSSFTSENANNEKSLYCFQKLYQSRTKRSLSLGQQGDILNVFKMSFLF